MNSQAHGALRKTLSDLRRSEPETRSAHRSVRPLLDDGDVERGVLRGRAGAEPARVGREIRHDELCRRDVLGARVACTSTTSAISPSTNSWARELRTRVVGVGEPAEEVARRVRAHDWAGRRGRAGEEPDGEVVARDTVVGVHVIEEVKGLAGRYRFQQMR